MIIDVNKKIIPAKSYIRNCWDFLLVAIKGIEPLAVGSYYYIVIVLSD